MWSLKGRQKDVKEVDSVCSYCGVGCNLTLNVRNNEIIRVTSKPDTWNEGWLCVKGRFGYGYVNSPDRLTKPLIKKNDTFEEVSWDFALDYISSKLKDIKKEFGADSIGGLSSARCTNEENYLFQKFIRSAIGTNNVDHCARL
jgi:predicted molibdopterin-dependent oxidoreductase YjgC